MIQSVNDQYYVKKAFDKRYYDNSFCIWVISLAPVPCTRRTPGKGPSPVAGRFSLVLVFRPLQLYPYVLLSAGLIEHEFNCNIKQQGYRKYGNYYKQNFQGASIQLEGIT